MKCEKIMKGEPIGLKGHRLSSRVSTCSRSTSRGSRSRRGRLIFVIGGASSGKSSVALALAKTRGARAFVATGQPLDREMAERISRHRRLRGPEWETVEVPVDLAGWFEKQGAGYRTIVLDCLTLWLNNLRERGLSEEQIPTLVSALLAAIRSTSARVVVVSNELGLGLVPLSAGARRFRDLAGQVNQLVAREADEVHFVVTGIPLRIK